MTRHDRTDRIQRPDRASGGFRPVGDLLAGHAAPDAGDRAPLRTGSRRARALADWLADDYAAAPGHWPAPAIVPVSTQARGADIADGPVVAIHDTIAQGIQLTLFGADCDPLGAMAVDLFDRVRRADVELGDGVRMALSARDLGPMPSGPDAMAFSVIPLERSPA